jgi:hypothetical protein
VGALSFLKEPSLGLTHSEASRRGGKRTLERHGAEHFQRIAAERQARARELAKLAPPLSLQEIVALRQIIAAAGLNAARPPSSQSGAAEEAGRAASAT